jgi:hypothetical protein
MASTNSSLAQRLSAARAQMDAFDRLRKEAFQPAPAMPQGAPPMDPAMMQQGAPPMDPAMMQQGAPPMDPSMMQQGAPPMDPAMMQQGAAPMDPAAAPTVTPEQLEEMMTLLEDMANGLGQAMQRIDALEQAAQQVGQQQEEILSTLQSAMQPAQDEAAPAGGW